MGAFVGFIIALIIGMVYWFWLDYQEHQYDVEWAKMRMRMEALMNNREAEEARKKMDEAFDAFFATECAVEPVQADEEPSPADLVLQTVEEPKWKS